MSHINENIDYTVSAYIMCNNKVLLRNHEKYSIWLPPSGHLEPNEDILDALHREVLEEVGLAITILGDPAHTYDDGNTDLPLPLSINKHSINEIHEHIDFAYDARSVSEDIHPGEGEMSDPERFKWFTEEELHNSPDVKQRVKAHALQALRLAQ